MWLIDLTTTLNVIGLLNCPITNCPIKKLSDNNLASESVEIRSFLNHNRGNCNFYDYTDYTSCLFCPTIELSNIKKRNLFRSQPWRNSSWNVTYPHLYLIQTISHMHVRLWNSLSAQFDFLLEPWESPTTATQLCSFLLQSSFSIYD